MNEQKVSDWNKEEQDGGRAMTLTRAGEMFQHVHEHAHDVGHRLGHPIQHEELDEFLGADVELPLRFG